eukprot:4904146-Amphidinium_carterae.1
MLRAGPAPRRSRSRVPQLDIMTTPGIRPEGGFALASSGCLLVWLSALWCSPQLKLAPVPRCLAGLKGPFRFPRLGRELTFLSFTSTPGVAGVFCLILSCPTTLGLVGENFFYELGRPPTLGLPPRPGRGEGLLLAPRTLR